MRIDGDIPLTDPAATVGAIEDRKMLGLEMWRPFHRHGAAAIVIRRSDFLLCESQRPQHIEVGFCQLCIGESQLLPAEILTQRILIKGKLDLKSLRQSAFHACECGVVEPLLPQRLMVNERCRLQGLPSDAIVHDVQNLKLGIPQCSEGFGYALVDDLEVASAG